MQLPREIFYDVIFFLFYLVNLHFCAPSTVIWHLCTGGGSFVALIITIFVPIPVISNTIIRGSGHE